MSISIFNITSSLPNYPVISWSQQNNTRVATPPSELQLTGFSGSQPVRHEHINFIQKSTLQRANFFSGTLGNMQEQAIEPTSSSLEVLKDELSSHIFNINKGSTRFRGHCVGEWYRTGNSGIWTSITQPGTHSPGVCDGNLTFSSLAGSGRFFVPFEGRPLHLPGNISNFTSTITEETYRAAFQRAGGFVNDNVVQINFIYPMNPLSYLIDLTPVWASVTSSVSTVDTAFNVNYQQTDMYPFVIRKDPSFFQVGFRDRNLNAVPIARIPNWNIDCSVWVREIEPIPRGRPAGTPRTQPKPPPDERFLF